MWDGRVAVGMGWLLACTLVACSGGTVTDVASSPTASEQSAGDFGDEPVVIGGYAASFQQVTDDFRRRSEDLQARVTPDTSDPSTIVAFYEELQIVARHARSLYGQLAPPDRVATVHQRILQLFDRQVLLLDDVVEGANTGDQQQLVTAVQGLVDLTGEFDDARRQMEQAIRSCGQDCVT